MKHSLLPIFALLSALVLACSSDSNGDGGNGGTTTGAEDGLTAQQVLERAAEEAGKVTSFHFELTHENGTTPLPMNLALEAAEGDVAVPDAVEATVTADAAGFSVDVDVIGVDGRTWFTNPFTGAWEELDGTNIRDFANPEALVGELLPAIADPRIDGRAEVGGVETYALVGNVDSAALQSALGVAEAGMSVEVEVWIGVDDLLPRRIRLNGPMADGEASNVVRQVDISNFNQPVTIEPPE